MALSNIFWRLKLRLQSRWLTSQIWMKPLYMFLENFLCHPVVLFFLNICPTNRMSLTLVVSVMFWSVQETDASYPVYMYVQNLNLLEKQP